MDWIVQTLWLIPVLPLLAAAVSALLNQRQRRLSAFLAVGSMTLALALSCAAFINALEHSGSGSTARQVVNFFWFQAGDPQVNGTALRLGWVLDPLTAVMLVMVSLVGLLIFIYSLGYMAHDENFARFFCFLSLFASAMLGVVIANSLLLLFICWEIVGLTSYLLIGFWYHKPSAAAAPRQMQWPRKSGTPLIHRCSGASRKISSGLKSQIRRQSNSTPGKPKFKLAL